jgi:hypothetical protein
LGKVLVLTVALLGLSMVPTAKAGVIAVWNFDNGSDNGSAFNGPVPYNANFFDHARINSSPTPTLNATANSGSSVLAGSGNGSATALEFKSASTGSSPSVSGSSFTLTLKAVISLNSFSITYDYRASNAGGGPAQNNWTYSINGGAQSSQFQVSITQDNTYHTATVLFTGLSLNAGDTIVFTDALAGYGGGHGNIADFDNILVNGVPEPANYALAAFGILFVGVGVGRRIYARARA